MLFPDPVYLVWVSYAQQFKNGSVIIILNVILVWIVDMQVLKIDVLVVTGRKMTIIITY